MQKMELLDYVNGKNFIDGKWITSRDQIDVINPADYERIGSIVNANEQEIHNAIESTVQGFYIWSKVSVADRVKFLQNWHKLVLENRQQLAHIVTLEQGKTLKDSESEVNYAASFIEWYAALLLGLEGNIKTGNDTKQKIIIEYEPIGPIAAITPWNFPLAMVTRKLAPALAAGCSVLLKPSELTSLSALMLAKLAQDAGILAGVINVITGKSSLIGRIICSAPQIRKLSFTGSTEVGKLLYQQSASSMKKLSLELGGNAPFIICRNVDLTKTVDDLITAKIRSNGQSCISPNRVFIHEDIYQNFTDILKDRFLKLKTGNGLDPNNDIGCLINKAAVDKITALIEDTKEKGAQIFGSNTYDNFLEPTIILDASDKMKIFSTEIFGPVIACYKFQTAQEVIASSNNTEYGLQAYVYSDDISEAQNITAKLDFGMVAINSPLPSNASAPFGGRKFSGFGIEGGKEGLLEYLNIKYTNLNYK